MAQKGKQPPNVKKKRQIKLEKGNAKPLKEGVE
jgi:hypothetical protein